MKIAIIFAIQVHFLTSTMRTCQNVHMTETWHIFKSMTLKIQKHNHNFRKGSLLNIDSEHED